MRGNGQLIVVTVGFQARDLLQLTCTLWLKYMLRVIFYHIVTNDFLRLLCIL